MTGTAPIRATSRRATANASPRPKAREQLLVAASMLMREGDTLDISLADIAARAAVNSALVKYYFGNKRGLLVALLERDLSEAIAQLTGLIEMVLSPTKKMQMHIGGIIRLFFRYPYLQALMIHVMRDGDGSMARVIADRYLRPISDAYARIIGEGVALGEFKPIDPKFFYSYVLGACDQIFSQRYVLKHIHGIDEMTDDLRRQYAEQLRVVILTGLRA